MAAITDCLRMAEMICSRLCHDLSGLLGTLSGMIELAAEGRDDDDEVLSLAEGTARELRSRLQLMRAAWGLDTDGLTPSALSDLVAGLPNAARIELETIAVETGATWSAEFGRVVLNVVMLGAECLPSGGRIILAGSSRDLFVRLLGPKAAWPAGFAACLADPETALAAISDPRRLQMPLTALWAHGLGVRLSMLMGPAAAGAPPPLRIGGG